MSIFIEGRGTGTVDTDLLSGRFVSVLHIVSFMIVLRARALLMPQINPIDTA